MLTNSLGVSGALPENRRWSLWLAYVCLFFFAVFFLFPPVYMLITSLKTNAELTNPDSSPWLISHGVTWDNYIYLFSNTNFPVFLRNTLIVSALTVVVTLIISIMAAYAIARLRFPGAGALGIGIFLTYLVPESLVYIPMFQIVGALDLLDRLWSLVLVYPTLTVPFCTWLMIGYFSSIPKEIEEAAMLDGANPVQILIKVFIPLSMPGIVAAAIFAFSVSWAAFLYPLAFIYSEDQMVLTVGITRSLVRGDIYNWGPLMAGALLAAMPPVVLYAFLMDYYVAGLTAKPAG